MILDAAAPTGAYELLDRLRQTRRGAAPPTVYRTLDFLLEQGLIHRVERLSAFVGCIAGCTADPDGESHTHAAQFLICRTCGRVVEMQDHAVSSVLARAAKEAGFTINAARPSRPRVCAARAGRCRRLAVAAAGWPADWLAGFAGARRALPA